MKQFGNINSVMDTRNHTKNQASLKKQMKTIGLVLLMLLCLNNGSNAQSKDSNLSRNIIGTWTTNLFVNGMAINVSVTFTEGGRISYLFTDAYGNKQNSTGVWSIKDGYLYEKDSYGNVAYGKLQFASNNVMNITVINNGYSQQTGQVRNYTKVTKNPSFTGMLKCNKCSCPGWPVGLGKNSTCTNVISISGKVCGHKYTDHE